MSQNSYPSYAYESGPYFNANLAGAARAFDGRPASQQPVKQMEPGAPAILDGPDARASMSRSFDGYSFSGYETSFPAGSSSFDLHSFLNGRSFAQRDASAAAYSNPITSFYNDADGPWNSFRATSQARSTSSNATLTVPAPNLEYHSYRDAPASEISDSGYASQTAASQSIVNTEPTDYNRECGDLSVQVNSFSFTGASSSSPPFDNPSFGGRNTEEAESRSTHRSKHMSNPLLCPRCGDTAKCPSDFKKHMLKHDKPFKCDEPDCTRKDGFTTINDLNRHKKSVHKIGGMTKSFRCVADRCKNKDKLWPRLDNFKQHVQRMHPQENLDDMIQRSQCFGNLAAAAPGTPRAEPVSPIEKTLAGIDSKTNTLDGAHQTDSPDFGLGHSRSEDSSANYMPDMKAAFPQVYPDAHQWGQPPYPSYDSEFGHPSQVSVDQKPVQTVVSDASRLKELADAAAASHPTNQLNSRNGSKSGPSKSQSTKRSTPMEDPQKKILTQVSNIIASHINNGAPNESLDKAVYRALLELEESQRIITPATNRRDSGARLRSDSKDAGLPPPSFGDPDGAETTISTAEVVAGLSALAKRIAQAKKPTVVLNGKSSRSQGVKCPECPKILPRNCDMNKHMKRHTRPYGCTFPKCRKVFGSKNDWKRHENSQHFQLETWRCEHQASPAAPKCAELFYHKNVFEKHLREQHRMDQLSDVALELRVRRIGRNGQSRFWCGFCKEIVELHNRGVQAWDERFDHIDEHFKQKLPIRDWLDIEANKPKGEVYASMDKNDYEDEDPSPAGGVHSSGTGSGSTGSDDEDHNSPSETGPGDDADIVILNPHSRKSSSVNGKKRAREDDGVDGVGEPPRKSKKGETLFFCCECRSGPFAWSLYQSCLDCDHPFCGRCDRRKHENTAEEAVDYNLLSYSGSVSDAVAVAAIGGGAIV